MCQYDRDMSGHDLYLVLRERLEAVADTIHIDAEILHDAQNARGFSNERIARELFISEKTWRRWKAKAAIPADRVDDVAEVLNLDIERPPARRVILAAEAQGVADQLAAVQHRLEQLGEAVDRLARGETEILAAIENARSQVLASLDPPPARPKRRRA